MKLLPIRNMVLRIDLDDDAYPDIVLYTVRGKIVFEVRKLQHSVVRISVTGASVTAFVIFMAKLLGYI